jgi:hypothetical protein
MQEQFLADCRLVLSNALTFTVDPGQQVHRETLALRSYMEAQISSKPALSSSYSSSSSSEVKPEGGSHGALHINSSSSSSMQPLSKDELRKVCRDVETLFKVIKGVRTGILLLCMLVM